MLEMSISEEEKKNFCNQVLQQKSHQRNNYLGSQGKIIWVILKRKTRDQKRKEIDGDAQVLTSDR